MPRRKHLCPMAVGRPQQSLRFRLASDLQSREGTSQHNADITSSSGQRLSEILRPASPGGRAHCSAMPRVSYAARGAIAGDPQLLTCNPCPGEGKDEPAQYQYDKSILPINGQYHSNIIWYGRLGWNVHYSALPLAARVRSSRPLV